VASSILVFFIVTAAVPKVMGFTTPKNFHRPSLPLLQSVRIMKRYHCSGVEGSSRYFLTPIVSVGASDRRRWALGSLEYETIGLRRRRRAALTAILAKKSSSHTASTKNSSKTSPNVALTGASEALEPLPDTTAALRKSPPSESVVAPVKSIQANADTATDENEASSLFMSASAPVYEQFSDRPMASRKKTVSNGGVLRNGYNAVVKTLSVKVDY
jgi:hypothetical protein